MRWPVGAMLAALLGYLSCSGGTGSDDEAKDLAEGWDPTGSHPLPNEGVTNPP
jgi:hypothetical protein